MSDHSSDCIDFLKGNKKSRAKNLASSSMGLTDKHINNVLRSLINSVDETEEEKELRLQNRGKREKKIRLLIKIKILIEVRILGPQRLKMLMKH